MMKDFFKNVDFTPFRVEQQLWGIELQEKERQKGWKKLGKLFRRGY